MLGHVRELPGEPYDGGACAPERAPAGRLCSTCAGALLELSMYLAQFEPEVRGRAALTDEPYGGHERGMQIEAHLGSE